MASEKGKADDKNTQTITSNDIMQSIKSDIQKRLESIDIDQLYSGLNKDPLEGQTDEDKMNEFKKFLKMPNRQRSERDVKHFDKYLIRDLQCFKGMDLNPM